MLTADCPDTFSEMLFLNSARGVSESEQREQALGPRRKQKTLYDIKNLQNEHGGDHAFQT